MQLIKLLDVSTTFILNQNRLIKAFNECLNIYIMCDIIPKIYCVIILAISHCKYIDILII